MLPNTEGTLLKAYLLEIIMDDRVTLLFPATLLLVHLSVQHLLATSHSTLVVCSL